MKKHLTSLLVIGTFVAALGTGVAVAADAPAAGAGAANTAGAAGGAATADITTLAKLHADNQKEIEHGKMAAEKGKSPQVKAFGKKLVADHTAADKKLLAYCKKNKIDEQALEAATKAETEKAAANPDMAKLHDATGEEFDKQFASMMAAEHGKSIETVTAARDGATDAALKQMLTKLLPVLEKHKATAEKISEKVSKS